MRGDFAFPLGNSRSRAFVYFEQLEKRLEKDPELTKEYLSQAMQEYIG